MENWHLGSLKCVPPLSRYNFRLPSSNLTDGFDHGSKAQFPLFIWNYLILAIWVIFKKLCYWENLAKFYTKKTNQTKNFPIFFPLLKHNSTPDLTRHWHPLGRLPARVSPAHPWPLGLNQGPFVVPGSQTGLCQWPITWGKLPNLLVQEKKRKNTDHHVIPPSAPKPHTPKKKKEIEIL
jgi:hypothetical protein